jgi:hypothetical protein
LKAVASVERNQLAGAIEAAQLARSLVNRRSHQHIAVARSWKTEERRELITYQGETSTTIKGQEEASLFGKIFLTGVWHQEAAESAWQRIA